MPLSKLSAKQLSLLLAPLVALTPFAIDTYLPALPQMAEHFNRNLADMGVTISIYLLGFALGQLSGGPLSDLYGRRQIALSGLLMFMLTALAITQTDRFPALVTLRFLQALGGGFATVVVAPTVRDYFQGRESAEVFSMIAMIMMLAPLTAPAVGSVMISFLPWSAIFALLALYAGVLLVLVNRIMSTQPAKGIGHIGFWAHSRKAYSAVFTKRDSFPHLFAQAAISGMLFVFVTNASYIFLGYYEVSTLWFPVCFAAMISASIFSNRLNLTLLKTHTRLSILRGGAALQNICALLLVGACYLELGLSWVLPLMMGIIGCIGLISANNMSLYLDHHQQHTGSANAVFSCCIFAAGAVLGGITTYFHDGTLFPVALTVFVSSCCGCWLVTRMKALPKADASMS